jgi:predicted nucleic acid-binding protein
LSIYADTSFVVSLYLRQHHSPVAVQRMSSKPDIWLTPLHSAEWLHAIERQVFEKNLSAHQARQLYAQFERDRSTGLWIEVALPESVFAVCCSLARRYTSRLGNRTLDTLHVASALELKATSFWTLDERQSKLAQLVGLSVNS